jgi:hypothetical protein
MEHLSPSNQEPGTGTDHTRRAFLRTLGGALAVGFVVQILGCTEADPLSSPTTGNNGGNCPQPNSMNKTAATDRTGTVSSNHGHSAIVTAAAQDTGTAYSLSIQGSAGHNHTLAMTAQDLTNLKAGSQVVKTTASDGTGHSHTVTFAMVTSILNPC